MGVGRQGQRQERRGGEGERQEQSPAKVATETPPQAGGARVCDAVVMRCPSRSVARCSRASLVALALAGLWLLGCGPRVVLSEVSCTRDQDCAASARCEQGRCEAAPDDGGQPLADAGTPDSGPPAVDAGHDAGEPMDAGRRDAGGPVSDGGSPADAGVHDAGDTDAGPGARDAGALPDAGAGDDAGACGGCPAPLLQAPVEVCGDGYDNDCDGLVDEAPCGQMRRINIPAGPLPAGYSLVIPVSAALLGNSDGSDVRVWRTLPGAQGVAFLELHRVLDPDEDWGDPHTLWFALPSALLTANGGEYRLTWGAPPSTASLITPPLADEREVFHFADFFEQPSEGGGPGWTFDENPDDHDIDVVNGALSFVAANELDGRPNARADFGTLTGLFTLDLRFHWEGTDGDDPEDYAWRVVLGNADMGTDPFTNDELEEAGIGPNLLWSGGMPSFSMPFDYALAVDGQPADPNAAEGATWRVLGSAGVTSARVLLEGDTADGTFRVTVNGQPYPTTGSGSFDFADGSVTLLNRLRIYTAELTIEDDRGFSPARFEHVILRPRRATEPSLTLSAHAPCP